jgi:nucleobase:cation symporter-1, NCS1 family
LQKLCEGGGRIAKQSIELELSSHYHQPQGVEQFGLEAIPQELKVVAWYDLFLIIVNFLINPASILIGGMSVVAGLSFWAAVAAQTLGCVIAFAAYITIATIGVDYGLPGQVATRVTFGLRGAKWLPSLLRVLASTYWFAFQTIAGSLVIVNILDHFSGGHHSLRFVSVLFGLGQVVVAVWGYQSLKILSRIAFPFKVVILILLWTQLARYHNPDFHPARVLHYQGIVGWKWALFAVWTNSMAAGWIVMITDAADFCRYSRSRMDMWVGTTSAALGGSFFCALLGAYGAAATLGKVSNFFVVVTSVDSRPLMLLAVLIVIVLDNWTINVLNLYTGGLSVSNIFESVGRFWTTLAVGVASILLSAFPGLVSGYLQYTGALGNLFAPVAGILLADYLFIQKRRISLPALFERDGPYWYWHGFNVLAVAWTLLGFALYVTTPVSWIQTLTTVLLTGTGYLATQRLVAERLSRRQLP